MQHHSSSVVGGSLTLLDLLGDYEIKALCDSMIHDEKYEEFGRKSYDFRRFEGNYPGVYRERWGNVGNLP